MGLQLLSPLAQGPHTCLVRITQMRCVLGAGRGNAPGARSSSHNSDVTYLAWSPHIWTGPMLAILPSGKAPTGPSVQCWSPRGHPMILCPQPLLPPHPGLGMPFPAGVCGVGVLLLSLPAPNPHLPGSLPGLPACCAFPGPRPPCRGRMALSSLLPHAALHVEDPSKAPTSCF